jgi:mono/diheme cytochrome c family protein
MFSGRRQALAVLVAGAALAGAVVVLMPGAPVGFGQAVYAEQCAACHGDRLQGQPEWRARGPNGRLPAPPHDATGHTWHHPDEQLFKMTKYGPLPSAPAGYQSDMPAFDGILTDAEIRDVLAYIKGTWSAKIRARQESINRRASP